jgi:hypothetical protein
VSSPVTAVSDYALLGLDKMEATLPILQQPADKVSPSADLRFLIKTHIKKSSRRQSRRRFSTSSFKETRREAGGRSSQLFSFFFYCRGFINS